jgi:hypothetical protein
MPPRAWPFWPSDPVDVTLNYFDDMYRNCITNISTHTTSFDLLSNFFARRSALYFVFPQSMVCRQRQMAKLGRRYFGWPVADVEANCKDDDDRGMLDMEATDGIFGATGVQTC